MQNSKTLSVNVKILITRFEGKWKYFSSTMLDSYRKLTLSSKVSTNHRFRKPQGNTALALVIVLYMLVKRQDLNFCFLKC